MITAEQLMKVAGDRRVELVYGELQDMTPVGYPHGRITVRLGRLLDSFAEEKKLGGVLNECGVVLARNPDVVRAPDICFISASRLAPLTPTGFFEGAPDLAVEVLSPDDRASEVQKKIQEYLQAGCQLVWVVDPESKTVTAYLPSGDAQVYRGPESVPGDPVLSGFSFQPDALFNLD